MIRIDDAQTYLDVLKDGSLSAVARQRGIAQTTVGRAIDRLEAEVGLKLLYRSARRLTATPAGRALAEQLEGLVTKAKDIEAGLDRLRLQPKGVIHVSCCSSYSGARLAPVFTRWQREHPGVRLELKLEMRWLDLQNEGVDLAVRTGVPPSGSQSIATKIDEYGHSIVASPEYLEANGDLGAPEDLAEHRIIGIRTDRAWTRWPFSGKRDVVMEMIPSVEVNEIAMARRLVEQGAGITALPDYVCERAVAAGRLIRLLPDWTLPRVPVVVLHPRRREMTAPARALLKALIG